MPNWVRVSVMSMAIWSSLLNSAQCKLQNNESTYWLNPTLIFRCINMIIVFRDCFLNKYATRWHGGGFGYCLCWVLHVCVGYFQVLWVASTYQNMPVGAMETLFMLTVWWVTMQYACSISDSEINVAEFLLLLKYLNSSCICFLLVMLYSLWNWSDVGDDLKRFRHLFFSWDF